MSPLPVDKVAATAINTAAKSNSDDEELFVKVRVNQ